MEALKLCLRDSSGSARQNQEQQFQTRWSSHPNAACGVNCPGASLQQEELGIGARSSPLGQWLCMLSPASWEGDGHHLLLRRGVTGAWWVPGVNQGQPSTSVQEHPSPFSPPTAGSIHPQGKQTEHCTAFHSVPKSEVISAFYLFHKQKEW